MLFPCSFVQLALESHGYLLDDASTLASAGVGDESIVRVLHRPADVSTATPGKQASRKLPFTSPSGEQKGTPARSGVAQPGGRPIDASYVCSSIVT